MKQGEQPDTAYSTLKSRVTNLGNARGFIRRCKPLTRAIIGRETLAKPGGCAPSLFTLIPCSRAKDARASVCFALRLDSINQLHIRCIHSFRDTIIPVKATNPCASSHPSLYSPACLTGRYRPTADYICATVSHPIRLRDILSSHGQTTVHQCEPLSNSEVREPTDRVAAQD